MHVYMKFFLRGSNIHILICYREMPLRTGLGMQINWILFMTYSLVHLYTLAHELL